MCSFTTSIFNIFKLVECKKIKHPIPSGTGKSGQDWLRWFHRSYPNISMRTPTWTYFVPPLLIFRRVGMKMNDCKTSGSCSSDTAYPLGLYHNQALEKWMNNPGRVVYVFQTSKIFAEALIKPAVPLNIIKEREKTKGK